MNKDLVQNIRDLMRPFLTVTFSLAFVIGILMSIRASIQVMITNSDFQIEPLLALIGLIGTPLGGIIVYHFLKTTTRDNAVKNEK